MVLLPFVTPQDIKIFSCVGIILHKYIESFVITFIEMMIYKRKRENT